MRVEEDGDVGKRDLFGELPYRELTGTYDGHTLVGWFCLFFKFF